MKKQPEITEATKKDFILAFCELYQQMPIEKITVKDVAEKAGYSRVTFYNYFNDIYSLLNYIEDDFISRIAEGISHNIEMSRELDNFVFAFDRLINDNELYTRVLLANPHSIQFFSRLKDRIIPLTLKSFGISPHNKRAKYAFELYITGIISMLRSWIKNGKDVPPEVLTELIKGILKDGLLSQLAN